MISRRFFPALAVIGVLAAHWTASAAAAEPWQEVRRALHGDCEQYQGRASGICMRAAADRMQQYSEESRSLYRRCLEEGRSRSECDREREEFWLSKLIH